MKKFNLSLIVAMMAMLSISCSDKEPNPVDPGKDGEMAYFSFNLATENLDGTRTGTTTAGTAEENVVHDVTILLYDGNTGVLAYRFDLDASGGAGNNFQGTDVATGSHVTAATTSRFVSAARQVVRTNYNMLVLANLRGNSDRIDPNLFTIGLSTIDGLTNVSATGAPAQWNQNGIFMSNANGPVPVSSAQLRSTSQDAESNPIAVNIDRILAKVGMSKDFPSTYRFENDKIITDKNAVIKNVLCGIDVINQLTYPVRQFAEYAHTVSGNNESYAGTMETYATSILANRKWMYATDPNFNSWFATHFTYLELPDLNQTPSLTALPNLSEGPFYQYATENTMTVQMQAATDYLEYTTSVVVQANIFPEGIDEDTGYYSYTDPHGAPKVFTHEEASQWFYSGSYPNNMEGLRDMLESPVCEFEFTYPAGPEPDRLMTSNGVTFHPEGINVYRIPIKHFPAGSLSDYEARGEVYGYYGVVRNNIYSVVIKTMDGPGVGDYAYISADINVNEWYVRPNQNEEL